MSDTRSSDPRATACDVCGLRSAASYCPNIQDEQHQRVLRGDARPNDAPCGVMLAAVTTRKVRCEREANHVGHHESGGYAWPQIEPCTQEAKPIGDYTRARDALAHLEGPTREQILSVATRLMREVRRETTELIQGLARDARVDNAKVEHPTDERGRVITPWEKLARQHESEERERLGREGVVLGEAAKAIRVSMRRAFEAGQSASCTDYPTSTRKGDGHGT